MHIINDKCLLLTSVTIHNTRRVGAEVACMNAREQENIQLEKCIAAANGVLSAATNLEEANVFRLAAIVVRSRYPEHASRVAKASEIWFEEHPDDRLSAGEVIRSGWVISMPRLRDMLQRRLSEINDSDTNPSH